MTGSFLRRWFTTATRQTYDWGTEVLIAVKFSVTLTSVVERIDWTVNSI